MQGQPQSGNDQKEIVILNTFSHQSVFTGAVRRLRKRGPEDPLGNTSTD